MEEQNKIVNDCKHMRTSIPSEPCDIKPMWAAGIIDKDRNLLCGATFVTRRHLITSRKCIVKHYKQAKDPFWVIGWNEKWLIKFVTFSYSHLFAIVELKDPVDEDNFGVMPVCFISTQDWVQPVNVSYRGVADKSIGKNADSIYDSHCQYTRNEEKDIYICTTESARCTNSTNKLFSIEDGSGIVSSRQATMQGVYLRKQWTDREYVGVFANSERLIGALCIYLNRCDEEIFSFFNIMPYFTHFIIIMKMHSCILWTLNQNSLCFSKKTYFMHKQLTIILTVQLSIPIIFVVAPVSIEVMDDDFDLPDEEATGSSFINDLFGGSAKRSAPARTSTFDDILATAAAAQNPVAEMSTRQATLSTTGASGNPVGTVSRLRDDSSTRQRPSSASGGPRQPAANRSQPSPLAEVQQPAIAGSQVQSQRNSATIDALVAEKEKELDQVRRELSSLRYEKTEDQKTIGELRRKLEFILEDHQRVLSHLHEEQRSELKEINRKHERELEEAKQEAAKNLEILSNIKQQESSFENVQSRMENLGFTLNYVRETVHSMAEKEEDVNKVIKLAEQQISERTQRLDDEKKAWEQNKDTSMQRMQEEMEKMRKDYTQEIVHGRQWLEEERHRLQAQRVAFQEEQTTIVQFIEQKKERATRQQGIHIEGEFLAREHDLLIRVVNEKALLEQQRREFEQQRNADVNRLRDEAEHLEKCLLQVENARRALEKARRDYEQKHEQLNEIRDMLVEYEQRSSSKIGGQPAAISTGGCFKLVLRLSKGALTTCRFSQASKAHPLTELAAPA
uniref:Peptidase S1 domain-containing protein n=1 Tax=Ditylenchus dipsaci TaxID=166011 RepID=A0A915CZG4_9BILA